MNNIVSVIVRFHDMKYLQLLKRAIQCLHSQDGILVQPIIVLQRMSREDEAEIRVAVDEQWFFKGAPVPVVISYTAPEPVDARSVLLNLGIEKHQQIGNRFLAVLDCDDMVYTHAYATLVRPLHEGNAVVSFASVDIADVIPLKDYEFIYSMKSPYVGKNKLDLLKDNFCPIHSYLIDTAKLEPGEVYFRAEMTRLEDYDFLLRVAGRHPCDFSNIGTKIGLYMMRSDGSNSTPPGIGLVTDRESGTEWKDSAERLASVRATYPIKFYASDF